MEAVHKNMKGLDHNSTKNIEFEVVVFFSSVNLKKTMGLTPSNRLFAFGFVFYAQFGFPLKSGPFGVSQG